MSVKIPGKNLDLLSSRLVDTLFLKQCLSIVSSLGSLAYALSGYSRCWRHMQLTHSPEGWPKDKPAPQLVSWWSTIIQWVRREEEEENHIESQMIVRSGIYS